jgi:hypothetical protein
MTVTPATIRAAVSLADQGFTICFIALELQLHRGTVRRILAAVAHPERDCAYAVRFSDVIAQLRREYRLGSLDDEEEAELIH